MMRLRKKCAGSQTSVLGNALFVISQNVTTFEAPSKSGLAIIQTSLTKTQLLPNEMTHLLRL
jgi:hypothetical protein